jgi:hypothetical protein
VTGQPTRHDLPVTYRDNLGLSESGPRRIGEWYARNDSNALIDAFNGEPAGRRGSLMSGTYALQIDESWGLYLGRRRLHSPMAMREECIAIRIEKIRRPQGSETLCERRDYGQSLFEYWNSPSSEPDALHFF